MAEPSWIEKYGKYFPIGGMQMASAIEWVRRMETERAERLAAGELTLEEQADELFPGFHEESTKIQTDIYGVGQEQQKLTGLYEYASMLAAEPMAKGTAEAITTGVAPWAMLPTQWKKFQLAQRYGWGSTPEQWVDLLEAEIADLDSQIEADEWRLIVMARIPELVLKGDVISFDQVLEIAPPPEGVTEEHILMVEEIFNKVATPSISGITPFKIITPEEKATEEQLKFLELTTRAVPVGLHQLTVDEILKSMEITVMPTVPSGLTLEEIRAGLRSAGLSDIEIDDFTTDSIEKLSADWAEVTALHEAFRTGIAEAKAPALTFGQRAKLIALQPVVAIGESLETYFNILPRPLAAAVLTNFPGVRETTWSREMTEMVDDYKLLGEGSWSAYQKAYVESDANWGLKLLLEILFDPTTYIGFGLLTKALKPLPRLSQFIGGVERGWLEMWNAPFLGIKGLIGRIPPTGGQMAAKNARSAVMQMHQDLGRTVGKRTGAGMSLASSKEVLLKQLQIFERDSMGAIITGDTQTVRFLLERQPMERATIERWLERLGIEGVDITDQGLMNAHYIIEKQFQGLPISNKQVAAEMISSIFGVDDMMEASKLLPKMENLVLDFKKSRFARARSVIESANSMKELQDNVFAEAEHIVNKGFGNPAYLQAQMFGKATSFVLKMERSPKFAAIRWIDRKITVPIAKQYLMFMNYGPFNVLETIFRGFLGGGRTIYPRSCKPSETLIRITKGLQVPYEFYEASGRMEMAVLLEGTTATMYAPGKLPGITKPLVIGGKRMGLSFKLAGKEYPISSLQDFNRYIADVQTQMRAYYFQEKYLQILAEGNPEVIAEIHRLVPKLPTMGFSKYYAAKELKDMQHLLERVGTVGPDDIRALADMPLKEIENNKAMATIDKAMDNFVDLDPMFKEMYREGISTGAIWKDIDGFSLGMKNTIREFYLQKLEAAGVMVENLSKGIATTPVKNGDDLIIRMGQLADMVSASEATVIDARMTAQINARRLTPAGRRTFHQVNYKQIAKFMEGVETNIDYMSRELKNIIRGEERLMDWSKVEFKGMTATQQADIKMWIDNLPLEIKGKVEAVVVDDGLADSLGARGVFLTSETRGSEGAIYRPGTIVIRSNINERVFYHEMMHSIQSEKIATGDYKFLLDWTDSVYGRGSEESKFVQKMADDSINYPQYFGEEMNKWRVHGDRPSEAMSNYFEQYATGKKMLAKHSDFFDSHLPKKHPRIDLSPEQQQRAIELLDNYVTQTKTWTKARTDEWDITSRLLDNEPGKGASKMDKQAFWDDFSFQRNLPWDEARVNMVQLKKQEAQLLGRLSETGTIPPLKLPQPMEFTGDLTPAHIAHIFQVSGDDLSKAGLVKLESMTMRSQAEFIDMVRTQASVIGDKYGKTLEQMGFTDEAIGRCYDQMVRGVGLDPAMLEPLTPILEPINSLNKELHAVYASKAMPEADYKLWQGAMTKYADDLGGMDIHKAGTAASDDWWKGKQAAVDKAQVDYSLSFTDYTNQNSFDAFMKVIYPFWTYESQRYLWIPREFLRRPGLATAMGKYTDYSDQGYITIPGTDIQFNLLRGTVFMGGFRRLRLRDYPEHYDLFPGMEILDYGMRLGFYPGTHIMLPIALMGAASPKHKAEIGEVFPAWLSTGLNAVRAIAPEEVERILQIIFPDRFRYYNIAMEVSNRGGDGYGIWRKKEDGITLTDEEERLWYSASKRIAIFGIAAEQTGFLRFRPQDLTQFYEDSASLIEKMTGVPVDVQQTIRNHQAVTGDRLQDIYPLNPLQQNILYELEGFEQWGGRITPLLPTSQQDVSNKIASYWADVERIHEAAYEKGFFGVEGEETLPSLTTLNTQFVNGEISPAEWLSVSGSILSRTADSIEDLSTSELYTDVPKTLEERIAYFEKLFGSVPIYHPAKELMWMYYQLQPELAYDEETGTYQRDFDTYYAHVDAMVEALPEDQRDEFLVTIQYNWTPTQKLYWWISREYLRPYRNVRQLVLTGFTPEEQAIIERWYVAPTGEKQVIQEQIHAETGNKLVSEYTSRLTTARKNLRLIDPELDAWVCFWKDLKPLTPQAVDIFNDLRSKYIK